MTDVHPALRAVARAIGASAVENIDVDEWWVSHLPEARAALNALRRDDALAKAVAHSLDFTPGSVLGDAVLAAVTDALDEIAAEPKLTVEDVLQIHNYDCHMPGGDLRCSCGKCVEDIYVHTADMLHEAGLLREDDA